MEGHPVFYDPGCPLRTTLAGALGIKSRLAQADYQEKQTMIVATPGPTIHVETEGGECIMCSYPFVSDTFRECVAKLPTKGNPLCRPRQWRQQSFQVT